MRLTRCECGHDEATHFADVKKVYMPDGTTQTVGFRGRCLGMGCDDAKGNALCSCYRPDKDSVGYIEQPKPKISIAALIKFPYVY